MAMYEVWAKCGHVGRRNYVAKVFAVIAEDGKEAALLARNIPRVKHHHKDAIISVKRIDKARFYEIINMNDKDDYFRCGSTQDQRFYCTLEVQKDSHFVDYRYIHEKREAKEGTRIHYKGKTKVRNPQRYYKFYDEFCVA